MIQFSSVLVACDFGETSRAALTYGVQLARALGGRLHVLHVPDVIEATAARFYPDSPGDPEANTIALATAQLRVVLASIEADPSTTVTVRHSPTPAHEIVSYAKELRADLVIVGTHGRNGVSRLLMGSVAEHVVRSAPCPVLVVHKNEHEFVLPDPVSVSARI